VSFLRELNLLMIGDVKISTDDSLLMMRGTWGLTDQWEVGDSSSLLGLGLRLRAGLK
jgi:hypothetical protein